jgi:hypothetical protein
MIPESSRLVTLVDRIPSPPPVKRLRGRPTLPGRAAQPVARPDWRAGLPLGGPHPTLGGLWPRGGRREHRAAGQGGGWHRKQRAAGAVPRTSIGTEAHWTKSGWRGPFYGWKLHLITVVAGVWIPLATELPPPMPMTVRKPAS